MPRPGISALGNTEICEKQIDLELYLACIENKRILPLDFKLEESGVENGNRLILF